MKLVRLKSLKNKTIVSMRAEEEIRYSLNDDVLLHVIFKEVTVFI